MQVILAYHCCCSITQSCLTVCDPMDFSSTPGFPVLHYLPEFAQTLVHWVGNAIQLSHPLSPLSPPGDLAQHQGLFQWVSSLKQVAKFVVSASASVLPMNILDWFPLGWTGWISFQPKGLSRVFSNITVQKHQFFSAQLSVSLSNHLILCRPLLLLPSIFPSIRGFSSESAIQIRWPRYWSFSFIINPSNKYSGLIFFRTNWFDLLVYRLANKFCPLKRQLFPHPKESQFCMDLQFISVFLIYKYLYYFTFSLTGRIFCLDPSLIMR